MPQVDHVVLVIVTIILLFIVAYMIWKADQISLKVREATDTVILDTPLEITQTSTREFRTLPLTVPNNATVTLMPTEVPLGSTLIITNPSTESTVFVRPGPGANIDPEPVTLGPGVSVSLSVTASTNYYVVLKR